jgi:prophage maintenance system killer protein
MAAYVLLACNEFDLTATEASDTQVVLDLAAGEQTEHQFVLWVRDNAEQTDEKR